MHGLFRTVHSAKTTQTKCQKTHIELNLSDIGVGTGGQGAHGQISRPNIGPKHS